MALLTSTFSTSTCSTCSTSTSSSSILLFFSAALCCLLLPALCAPVSVSVSVSVPVRDGSCAAVRSSSMDLHSIAKSIYVLNVSKDEVPVPTALAWMEAKDMCDPGSLRHTSVRCIEKMLQVLCGYRASVEQLAAFKSCSEFAASLRPAVQRLQTDMSACLKSRGGTDHLDEPRSSRGAETLIHHWEETPLCHYTMNRLFSFSIMAARVFAVGDPSGHGSAQSSTPCVVVS